MQEAVEFFRQVLLLKNAVYSFSNGMLPGVTCLGHAYPDAFAFERFGVLSVQVLPAPVGMMDKTVTPLRFHIY